jgi:hypothetical protein
MMKRVALGIALVVTLTTFCAEARAQGANSSDSSEYLIKAGFIYNFPKLVEWPAAASGVGMPITIGVIGNDAFADVLEHTVDGKKIDGRSFVVKRLRWKDYRECNCHILFIAAQESAHDDEIIQALRAAPVLTISETPGFTKRGGIINFTLQDSKVRFEANVDAAKQAGLNISSRLLSLASIVQTNMSR